MCIDKQPGYLKEPFTEEDYVFHWSIMFNFNSKAVSGIYNQSHQVTMHHPMACQAKLPSPRCNDNISKQLDLFKAESTTHFLLIGVSVKRGFV